MHLQHFVVALTPEPFYVEDMKDRPLTLRIRPLHGKDDRAAYWLSRPARERIHAVGVINLTVDGEKYAQQELPRVYRVIKREGR